MEPLAACWSTGLLSWRHHAGRFGGGHVSLQGLCIVLLLVHQPALQSLHARSTLTVIH